MRNPGRSRIACTCRISVFRVASTVTLAYHAGALAGPIRIVENGIPRAAAAVPTACDPQTKAAAELLAEYIGESSGAELKVLLEDDAGAGTQPVTMHVGPDAYVKGLNLDDLAIYRIE